MNKSNLIEKLNTEIILKEKEYEKLTIILSRRISNEIEEDIISYQITYKDKYKQLSQIEDELYQYRNQTKVLQSQINDLDNEMKRLTKKWVKAKRDEERSKKAAAGAEELVAQYQQYLQ